MLFLSCEQAIYSTDRGFIKDGGMRVLHVSAVCLAGLLACFYLRSSHALSVADLTNRDAAQGIKGALDKGAASAIEKLGVAGGFLNNPKVKSRCHRPSMRSPRACA